MKKIARESVPELFNDAFILFYIYTYNPGLLSWKYVRTYWSANHNQG